MNKQQIQRAIERAGGKAQARRMTLQSLERDPDQEAAWLLLAAIATRPAERSHALRQALRVNPHNRTTRQQVKRLAYAAIERTTGRNYRAERLSARRRRGRAVVWGVMLLILVGLVIAAASLLGVGQPYNTADDAPTDLARRCALDIEFLTVSMPSRCGRGNHGEACLMQGAITASGPASQTFTTAGDRIRLSDVRALQAAPYRVGQGWGLAVLWSDDDLTALLIGEGTLERITPDLDQLTILSPSMTPPCSNIAPNGLLLVTSAPQTISVNQLMRVRWWGVAFIQAEPNGFLRYTQLDGWGEVAISGNPRRVLKGQTMVAPTSAQGLPSGARMLDDHPNNHDRLTLADFRALETIAGLVNLTWQSAPSALDGTPHPALVYAAAEGLYLFTPAENAQLLPSSAPGDDHPSLSADGSRVAFSRDGNLYLITLREETLTQVTDNPAQDDFPRWVGDDYLIFTSDRGGSPQAWLLTLSSGALRQLSNAANGIVQADVAYPDGPLAYSLPEGGVVVVQPDGQSHLLPDRNARQPAWNWDGSLLAYQSTQEAAPTLWIYDLATDTVTPTGISGTAPTWNLFLDDTTNQPQLGFIQAGDFGQIILDHPPPQVLVDGPLQAPTWGWISNR